jgi:hypothetical protein
MLSQRVMVFNQQILHPRYCVHIRYDNVTLCPLCSQRGLRFGPIQRNGAAPGVIHTGRFFVPIPFKWLEKLTGVKDQYI